MVNVIYHKFLAEELARRPWRRKHKVRQLNSSEKPNAAHLVLLYHRSSLRMGSTLGVLLCACLFLSFFSPVSALADSSDVSGECTDITKEARVFLNGVPGDYTALRDRSISTKQKIQAGDTLKITCEDPAAYLYMKFNQPPKPYSLTAGETEIRCGENGFLHELIPLDTPTREMTLQLDQTEICELTLYSPGNLPKEVQRWNPPYEDADLLLLPTHADDEHIYFGGIMPLYAGELGKKVQVAYLTNHWGEPYRPHELLDGLWEVGVTAYPVLSEFPDYYSESLEHARTLYDMEKMLGYQVELLRRFRPEVVVGHDVNGEYGHGVHRLNTWLLMQAIEQSEDASCYPDSALRYGTFQIQKTYLHLYPEHPLTMEIDTPLSAFGGKTAYEKAVEGFSRHTSQQKYFTVREDGKYDCRKFGLYRTTVGFDTGNDLLEHVTFSDIPDVPESSEMTSSEPVPSEVPPVSSSPVSFPETGGNAEDERPFRMILILCGGLLATVLILFFVQHRLRKKKR